MAFTDGIRTFEAGLVDRMRASFVEARKAYRRHQAYRKTCNELSALTDLELADIDIARANIRDIARTATQAD